MLHLSLCLCFSVFVSLSLNQSQNLEHNDPWWHATQPFEIHSIQNSENEFEIFSLHKFVPRKLVVGQPTEIASKRTKKKKNDSINLFIEFPVAWSRRISNWNWVVLKVLYLFIFCRIKYPKTVLSSHTSNPKMEFVSKCWHFSWMAKMEMPEIVKR